MPATHQITDIALYLPISELPTHMSTMWYGKDNIIYLVIMATPPTSHC